MNNLLDSGSIFDVNECPAGFYGEWVPVYNEEDKKDAHEYLRLWKKFLLLKLHYMQQKGEEVIIERTQSTLGDFINVKPTLGIKIELEKKL